MTDLIKDPTEQKLDEHERAITNTYIALNNCSEYWIIAARGAFAFRFGPYDGKEAGEILSRAVKERIAVSVVGQCGREFDWDIARDIGMRLVLPEDRPLGFWRRLFKRWRTQ